MMIYMVTTAFAVSLGLLVGNLFKPGRGIEIAENAAAGGVNPDTTTPSLVETFINIVPTNPFNAIVEGNVLPVIFFCLLFGIGLAYVRNSDDELTSKSGEAVFRFFNGGAEIMYLVVHWILQYAPIGVFALIANVFADQGADAFGPLMWVTVAVYIGFLSHMLFVYGTLLTIFRLSPSCYRKNP